MAADLLLVVHDHVTADTLQRHLVQAGWRPRCVPDARSAAAAMAVHPWAAVLLDLALPDGQGPALCRNLRRDAPALPLLALVAAGAADPAASRVQGLRLGADDVLAPPVSMPELVARMRALLRRAAARGPEFPWRFGGGRLDLRRRRLVRSGGSGSSVGLTRREFDLLVCLLTRPGRAWRRSDLLAAVWGSGFDGDSHTVDVHVNRLRAKLELDPRRPRHIVTVRGEGYRFDDQA